MVVRIETGLRLENSSKAESDDWWQWSVWVEGPPDELARVRSVTYRLHPTFPRPVVEVSDASSRFRLEAAGWGEFKIAADVNFQDGGSQRLERWLRLGDSAPAKGAAGPRPSVFVSHSVADSDVVQALREELDKQGIDLWTDDTDAAASSSASVVPLSKLDRADLVVALVSDPPSRFVEQEALTARQAGRPVVPVALRGAKVQSGLADLARFELLDAKNVPALADHLAAQVIDRTTPEENAI